MKTLKEFLFVGVLLTPLTLLFQAHALGADSSGAAEEEKSWTFDIVPYLWLANIDGTFSVPNLPTALSDVQTRSDNDFSTGISAVAMLTARVRYHNFGLLFDGAWLQLKTEGTSTSSAYSGADIKNDIGFAVPALSYRLPNLGHLETDLFAGARVWYFLTEVDLYPGSSPATSVSNSRTWVDPILGAHLRYDLSRHWFATVRGDAGGFGTGSGLSWSAFGGFGYSFTDWFSATLGYRYFHVDYEQDQFRADANLHGFLLGLGFHF